MGTVSSTAMGHLPRLAAEAYCGLAIVHWVMATENRATGWLTPLAHARFREVLLHAATRYELMCPVYCLMPDHVHLLLLGTSAQSDQRRAVRFVRRYTAAALLPHRWQVEPYDHLLRKEERDRAAFAASCEYILQNPVRAALVADWTNYAYAGAVVPGYPEFGPQQRDFWDVFWRQYNHLVGV